MKSLRLLLSIALAGTLTAPGTLVLAQDTDASPFSISLVPVQYAHVKGNVGKFEELNWMPNGNNSGVSDISFIKDINKNVSVDVGGSYFPDSETGKAHLILKDADLAFLKIDYNAFRKYYDGSGGLWPYGSGSTRLPAVDQGAQPNTSQDLQMDVSFFKLETGLGPMDDPFIDFLYEHNSKDGAKSLEQWESVYPGTGASSSGQKKIGPAWESVNDYTDTITLSVKKVIAGVTVKANQSAEIDYNHNVTYMQYLNDHTIASPNQLNTQNESPDAKLFGSGIRFEKWMFNDNTFAGLGYHYNHTSATDLMQNQEFNSVTGALMGSGSSQTGWSYAHAIEDEHVWTGNFNTNLRPDLEFITDAKYEHMGSQGNSYLLEDSTNYAVLQSVDTQVMDNQQDNVGEHMALRYAGIPHTALYAETDLEQQRGKTYESYFSTHSPTSDFLINRLDRIQTNSWTLGGRVIPNRFFTFTNEVKQTWKNNNYDTLKAWNPSNQIFLDALKENSIEDSSTLTWKPYRWLQNSLKYQFYNTDYMPRQAAEGSAVAQYNFSKNKMLTSQFTYDITIEPIDPLMMVLSYSHVENYVRIVGASSAGTPATYIPDFNSGDNSFMFAVNYTPIENLTWTNSACYTVSDNYVDFNTGVPLGSNFKMLNFTTSLEYTYHKWLKVGPMYEYATYKDDPLTGVGNYSANIFELNLKFDW